MTRDLPLVSIVTPTFNQGATIRETIDSVASQTYPAVEHIVIDGGSTDETVEILRSAPRVRSISEKDRGQTHAINKGLRMARGEIVAYLNSDDLYLPHAVAAAVDALRSHPEVELVYGDGLVIDGDGATLWEWLSRPEDWRLLTGYFFLWNDFTNYIMQQATFWRRRLHDRVGWFDEDFHLTMDIEFWLRVGASGAGMLHLPVQLAKFRMAPGTKSLSSPTVFWEDQLELFRRYARPRLGRFVEQYLFEEMNRNGASLDEARARYRAIARRRWAALPDFTALEALDESAALGALVRFANHAWNTGDAARARALWGEALRRSRAALVHRRALALLAKLSSGPLAPHLRRAWLKGIERYRDWRYQYRYREKRPAAH